MKDNNVAQAQEEYFKLAYILTSISTLEFHVLKWLNEANPT